MHAAVAAAHATAFVCVMQLRYIAQYGHTFSKAAGSGGGGGGGGGAEGGGGGGGDVEGVWQEEFEDDGNKHWARFVSRLTCNV